MPEARQLVTIEKAAAYLDCRPLTVRRMIAAGTITGYRLGTRAVRVDLNEIDRRALQVIPAGPQS